MVTLLVWKSLSGDDRWLYARGERGVLMHYMRELENLGVLDVFIIDGTSMESLKAMFYQISDGFEAEEFIS